MIAKAKANAVYKGGKVRIDRSAVIGLKEEGKGPTDIARELGMHECMFIGCYAGPRETEPVLRQRCGSAPITSCAWRAPEQLVCRAK